MIPHIKVEPEFDAVVRTGGGILVSDLVGKSPPFDNADYIFHEHKIIGELKCLQRDKADDPSTRSRLGRLWIKWRQRGLVHGRTPSLIDSRRLPEICQNEMYREMGKPIKRRIQKANTQIRETKRALALDDYRGVLFLANEGNFLFAPAAMIHYIQLALQREFREIRHFVFFTANMFTVMRGLNRPAAVWISFDMENAASIADTFFNTLHSTWTRRYIEITGWPGQVAELQDMEAFWHSQYLR